MITEKENYLRTLRGECPEWVSTYVVGAKPERGVTASAVCAPGLLCDFRRAGGGKDIWGVNYVSTYETGGALIPEPSNFILDDVTKWRDVIKAPELSGIDWEAMARHDIELAGIDRSQSALAFNLHFGYFQNLMAFMGFTEGLCAMYEYPDEVHELFEYLCDFYCTVAERSIDYFKPDVYTMMDDTAAWAAPFISPDMYREFLIPLYDRQAKFGRDRGLPIDMHNCGKSECFMEDLHNIGVTMWDPAQTCNDLDAFKDKYGNSFVIAGGWDGRDNLLSPDVTDDEIYESVRKTIERYAQGGGYVFCGGFLGPVNDTETKRKNAVIQKAVYEVGHSIYK